MRARLLILLAISFVLQIQSALPVESSFLVLVALLSFFSFQTVWVLGMIVAMGLDAFSPVKGLSVIATTAGMVCVFGLSRHLLTNRSLMAYYTLSMAGWAVVIGTKILTLLLIGSWRGTWNVTVFAHAYPFIQIGQGFLLSSGIACMVYALLLLDERALHQPHRSRSV